MNKQQWQSHIEAWQKSGTSKIAYARDHGLEYSQFLYWHRKLSRKSAASDFVSVNLKSEDDASKGLATLVFPNGIKLTIHN